jgi:hypothetical protein
MFSSQSCSQSLTIKYINKTFNNQISIAICSGSLSAIKASEDCNSCTYLVQLIHNEIRTAEAKISSCTSYGFRDMPAIMVMN